MRILLIFLFITSPLFSSEIKKVKDYLERTKTLDTNVVQIIISEEDCRKCFTLKINDLLNDLEEKNIKTDLYFDSPKLKDAKKYEPLLIKDLKHISIDSNGIKEKYLYYKKKDIALLIKFNFATPTDSIKNILFDFIENYNLKEKRIKLNDSIFISSINRKYLYNNNLYFFDQYSGLAYELNLENKYLEKLNTNFDSLRTHYIKENEDATIVWSRDNKVDSTEYFKKSLKLRPVARKLMNFTTIDNELALVFKFPIKMIEYLNPPDVVNSDRPMKKKYITYFYKTKSKQLINADTQFYITLHSNDSTFIFNSIDTANKKSRDHVLYLKKKLNTTENLDTIDIMDSYPYDIYENPDYIQFIYNIDGNFKMEVYNKKQKNIKEFNLDLGFDYTLVSQSGFSNEYITLYFDNNIIVNVNKIDVLELDYFLILDKKWEEETEVYDYFVQRDKDKFKLFYYDEYQRLTILDLKK